LSFSSPDERCWVDTKTIDSLASQGVLGVKDNVYALRNPNTMFLDVSTENLLGERENQEDAFHTDSTTGLFIVADGMGGHAKGEEASRVAVEHISGAPNLRFGFRRANEAVKAIPREGWSKAPGTTAVALRLSLFDGRYKATIAHIGDSRCYLARWGKLHRLTIDHGIGHRLGRLIGCSSGDGIPDVSTIRVEPHDRFLLCSDGLHGKLDDDEIGRRLVGHSVADSSMRLAECDPSDNLTLIVVEVLA